MTTAVEQWMQKGRLEGWREGRQEGRQEGRREGLLAGIELALDLKLGAAGLALMPDIARIRDVGVLESVHAAIRTAGTAEDVRQVYAAGGGS